MAFYSITLRPPDEVKPEAEVLPFQVVPPIIVALFQDTEQDCPIDNAILTFKDGTQVIWGTTP